MTQPFHLAMPLTAAELDQWHQQGRRAALWLRDDDAVTDTPALRQFAETCERSGVPATIAAVPRPADAGLVRVAQAFPLLGFATHGWCHKNYAPAGEKANEWHGSRADAEVLALLQEGRAALDALLGSRLSNMHVPPWNRISAAAIGLVAQAGYEAISCFGEEQAVAAPAGLSVVNTHVDIMHWRPTAHVRTVQGRALALVDRDLAMVLERRRADGGGPVGILTHHLVHDQQAWSTIEQLITGTARHPAVRWLTTDALLSG